MGLGKGLGVKAGGHREMSLRRGLRDRTGGYREVGLGKDLGDRARGRREIGLRRAGVCGTGQEGTGRWVWAALGALVRGLWGIILEVCGGQLEAPACQTVPGVGGAWQGRVTGLWSFGQDRRVRGGGIWAMLGSLGQ